MLAVPKVVVGPSNGMGLIPKVPLGMFLKMLIWSSYPSPSILSLFMRQFTRKRQSKEDNFYLLLIVLGLFLLHCTGV